MPLPPPRAHSLRTFLFLGLGSVGLAFVLVSVGLRRHLEASLQQQSDAQVRSLSRYRAQQELMLVLLDQEVGLRSFLGTGETAFLEAYARGGREEQDALRTTLDNLPADAGAEARGRVKHLEFTIHTWHDAFATPLIRQRLAGPLPDLRKAVEMEDKAFAQIRASSEALRAVLDAKDEALLERVAADLEWARRVGIAVPVVLVLCGLALARWLLKRVAAPLADLAEEARAGAGFAEPGQHQPVKEVQILAQTLYELDVRNREREGQLRREHDDALATRDFEALAQHLSRETDLLEALDQALSRLLQTSSQAILLRPESGDGLVTQAPGGAGRLAEDAGRCRAIQVAGPVSLAADAPTACLCDVGLPEVGSYLCVPLVASGRTLGVVNLQARNTGHWTPERRRLAENLVSAGASALQSIRALERAQDQAVRDALTGVHNRRFLDEMLAKLGGQAGRNRFPISALMLDIDHFKAFNDRFGHEGGDHVLRTFAQALLGQVREGDLVARYGGEEFTILLPHAGPDQALELAERLRRTVAALPLPAGEFPPDLHITTSIGAASFPEHAAALADLLPLADQALYEAKGRGRNRVVGAGQLGSMLG